MDREIILENDWLKALVSLRGAELKALILKSSGRSLLWEGRSPVWTGSAPWLFPIVGRLKEDRFQWKGTWYTMPQHGFAKDSSFTCTERSESSAVFTLCESPESLALYPWSFHLSIAYCLHGKALAITAQVTNTGTEAMYFSFGAHPGFYGAPGDRLCFGTPEDTAVYRLAPQSHLLLAQSQEHLKGDTLPLTPALFEKDAMILQSPRSRQITLLRSEGPGVSFSYPAVPYLGIWSRPGQGMPYVCMEPWFGVDDGEHADGDITRKNAIQMLEPGQRFTMPMCMEAMEEKS